MKKSLSLILALALTMALMLGLAGCGQSGQSTDQTKEGQQEQTAEKEYIVATEPTFPPFEFRDEKTSEITGFDIDLIKAIAQETGIKVKIQSLGFDGLIPALQAGNIDIVASGMTITKKRALQVSFTKPYFDAGLKIAVPANNTTIKGIDDLKGKTVAVQIGTTGANKAQELLDKKIIAKVKTFNTADAIFLELLNGTVDAVINDLPVNEAYMSKNPGKIKMVGNVLNGEQYGFAVAKDNQELLKKLNTGLEKVKANGKYDELKVKYFGGK
ncbi:basic amino acid ABC transporter substrate-binding protein [Bacillota bacterium LX-D]|nr:basic amino acid ABC transporter substrate-binding protein [Bacillota bacterium LX-D]